MSTPIVAPSGRRTLLSVLAGVGAAVVGGVLWGLVLGYANFRFGIVAVGVGAGVGMAMARTATPTRGLAPVAAVVALGGCVLGEMFGDVIAQAKFEKVPLGEAIRLTVGNPDLAGQIFADQFDPVGVVFWAIGAWAAFSFVRKAVAALEAEIAARRAATTGVPVPGAPAAGAAAPSGMPSAAPSGTDVPPTGPQPGTGL